MSRKYNAPGVDFNHGRTTIPLDPRADRQLEDAGAYVKFRLNLSVSRSAILRRALEMYAEHLDGIKAKSDLNDKTLTFAEIAEQRAYEKVRRARPATEA